MLSLFNIFIFIFLYIYKYLYIFVFFLLFVVCCFCVCLLCFINCLIKTHSIMLVCCFACPSLHLPSISGDFGCITLIQSIYLYKKHGIIVVLVSKNIHSISLYDVIYEGRVFSFLLLLLLLGKWEAGGDVKNILASTCSYTCRYFLFLFIII